MDNHFANSVAAASAVSPSSSLCSSVASSVQMLGAGPSSSHTSPMMMYLEQLQQNPHFSGGGEGVAGTAAADQAEEEESEQCLVCSDVATGYHYGTPSCNGCKTFFRRTVMKNQTFQCQYDGNCPVDKTVRCACRHCRFKKCLAVGMNKDAIQQNRDPIGYTKRTRRYPSDKQPRQKQSTSQSALTNSFNPMMPNTSASANGSSALTTHAAWMPSSSFAPGGGPSAFKPACVGGAPFPFGAGSYANSHGTNNMQMQQQQQKFFQQQQQQQKKNFAAGADGGTNSSHFGIRRNSRSSGGGVGFMFGGGADTCSNAGASSSSSLTPNYCNGGTNAKNGSCGAGDDKRKPQQQQKQEQNIVTAEQMEEDKQFRRLIGVEQILIRIRNSKVSVQKTLSEAMMDTKSLFDDATLVAKMSLESFQMPAILHRAKQDDFVYWHEREWLLMIEWAKMLPVYHTLPLTDKLALLRHSAITFPSLIQCFYSPNVGPDTIVFPNGAFFDRTIDPTSASGFQHKNFKMLDNMLNPIRKMQIDQNEFACAKAIFFLNPDSDADDLSPEAKKSIAATRSAITNSLYRYMVQKRGMEQAADKFGKLLLLGTSIATMSCEMKEAVVVADFFDQVHFSSFARKLLLARDENDIQDDGGGGEAKQQKVKEEIANMRMMLATRPPDSTAVVGTTTPTTKVSTPVPSASAPTHLMMMAMNNGNSPVQMGGTTTQMATRLPSSSAPMAPSSSAPPYWAMMNNNYNPNPTNNCQQLQQQIWFGQHYNTQQQQQFGQSHGIAGTAANVSGNATNYWPNNGSFNNNNNNNNPPINKAQQQQWAAWMGMHGGAGGTHWMPSSQVPESATARPVEPPTMAAASTPAESMASTATTSAPLEEDDASSDSEESAASSPASSSVVSEAASPAAAYMMDQQQQQQQQYHHHYGLSSALNSATQPWAQQQAQPPFSSAVSDTAVASWTVPTTATTKPTTTTSAWTSPAVGSDGIAAFNPLQTHLMPEASQPIEETSVVTSLHDHHKQQFHYPFTDIYSFQQPPTGTINPPSNGSISQQSSTSPPSLTNVTTM